MIDGNLISGPTYHDHGPFVGPWVNLVSDARSNAEPACPADEQTTATWTRGRLEWDKSLGYDNLTLAHPPANGLRRVRR